MSRTHSKAGKKKRGASRRGRTPLRRLQIHPLTPRRWADLEKLFGERGASGGCWCMWWRVTRSQFEKQKGRGNKMALKRITQAGEVPGLLAYSNGQPVGWCSVAPRSAFPVLDRSRVLGRVDEHPVWSVVCFFVARPYRRRGVSEALLGAAVSYARRHGARIVEGYPVEPRKKSGIPDVFAWTGLPGAFRAAGFTEVLRRSETRPIMRRVLRSDAD